MKYEVIFSSYANRDIAILAEILAPYPNKARRLFSEMERKLDLLKNNPLMCEQYSTAPKYRRMNLEDHTLFYTVDESNRQIRIYRVIYSKRDISKLLNN